MNDRFNFRLPFYNNKGEFSHFEFILIGKSLPAYNAGVMFHRSEYEQCTEFSDKNEKLIYEGDIVEITVFGSIGPNGGYVDSDTQYQGVVVWTKQGFYVKVVDNFFYMPEDSEDIKIIGNIHTGTKGE